MKSLTKGWFKSQMLSSNVITFWKSTGNVNTFNFFNSNHFNSFIIQWLNGIVVTSEYRVLQCVTLTSKSDTHIKWLCFYASMFSWEIVFVSLSVNFLHVIIDFIVVVVTKKPKTMQFQYMFSLMHTYILKHFTGLNPLNPV